MQSGKVRGRGIDEHDGQYGVQGKADDAADQQISKGTAALHTRSMLVIGVTQVRGTVSRETCASQAMVTIRRRFSFFLMGGKHTHVSEPSAF